MPFVILYFYVILVKLIENRKNYGADLGIVKRVFSLITNDF